MSHNYIKVLKENIGEEEKSTMPPYGDAQLIAQCLNRAK